MIRSYEASDKKQCLRIFQSNIPKFFAVSEEADFLAHLENPEHYFVLEKNNQLLGCGGYGILDKQGYLAWGMVHASQHGTGLGKRLLLERLSLISQHEPVTSIVLDTSQHTFGFFEKLGFVTKNITNDGYAPGLHRYDMELAVAADSRQRIAEKLALLLNGIIP